MTDARINQWRWTARVLALLGLLAGVMAAASKLPAMVQDYAALAVSLLGVGHYWIIGFLPVAPKRAPVLPVLLLLLAGGLMWSACNPYSIAWRTLDGVQQARALTAQQLASTGHRRHEVCLATHGPNTDGYRVCIEPTAKMLRHWQREARPAIIAAVQITASSLQIAERVKADKKVKWLELLKPALCALSRVVKLYSHYLPDEGASIVGVLGMVEGVTCGR